jgi:hypothetical protein
VQDGVEVLVAVTKQTQQELPDDLVRFVSQRLHHSSTHATPTEQYFLDHLLTTLQIKPPHMKFAEWDEMRKKTVAVWTNAFSALQQQKSSPGLSHATLTAA